MVSFHCLRDDKCEWRKGLRDFAIQFNETFGKDYSLSKFLDISEKGSKQSTKQPEVLLPGFLTREKKTPGLARFRIN
ncbi:hypothetical protein H6H03_36525 [Nostoc paludosum FACHB-159]|uniref:Transposase n=1 Tax=Nostoc paludosum FACHB-159 TaxID=2692908 RepID=A0ABR8KK72_9NOSO|nr:hypothetical protein [Nostoc paludosum FACHB-159]